jgi:Flp pilus assembly protein TadB
LNERISKTTLEKRERERERKQERERERERERESERREREREKEKEKERKREQKCGRLCYRPGQHEKSANYTVWKSGLVCTVVNKP